MISNLIFSWQTFHLPFALSLVRDFSSNLLHAIILCNHLPFFKVFSNFVHFCPNFQIFCPFCPFWTFFRPFLPFFWKISCMPLLSRIGTVDRNKPLFKLWINKQFCWDICLLLFHFYFIYIKETTEPEMCNLEQNVDKTSYIYKYRSLNFFNNTVKLHVSYILTWKKAELMLDMKQF